jgi:tryptophanase
MPVKPERVKPELGLSVADFGFNQVVVPSNEVLCDMLSDSSGGTYTVEQKTLIQAYTRLVDK